MLFQKGQSGNSAGRPRGSRNRATALFHDLLEDDAEAIARKVIELAKAGDMSAIRICMDRLAPARRGEPVAFDLPALDKAADTVAAVTRIAAAVAEGELAPAEAAELAKVIDIYLRTLATTGFEERLAKLESAAERRAATQAGTQAGTQAETQAGTQAGTQARTQVPLHDRS